MYNHSYLNEIISRIKSEKVSLFLGAGASKAAGAPLGAEFVEHLKERFPKSDITKTDFMELCADIIETKPYTRNELEEFIKKKLEMYIPTKAHKNMTKYNWEVIFTTNFDDLIENAYRNNVDIRYKRCKEISTDNYKVNIKDTEFVYLFKIMGSVNGTEENSSNMILTSKDYRNSLKRREEYFRTLSDFLKDGNMLFIGYSFGDSIALDIIDDLVDIYGRDRIGYSYAIFDKIDTTDEKYLDRLSKRKIIPIEIDFQNFFKKLEDEYPNVEKTNFIDSEIVKIRGYNIPVYKDDCKQYYEYFDFMNEKKLVEKEYEKNDFFKGNIDLQGAYYEGIDFKREIYIRDIGNKIGLKDRIFEEIKNYDVSNNKIIILKGMAGTGKSILLNRIAYDLSSSGEAIVLKLDSKKSNFDYKVISSFIDDINKKYNEKLGEEHAPPIKTVILVDNAGAYVRMISRLKDYLTSIGKSVLIIGAEKSGEWENSYKTYQFNLSEKNIYSLSETFTETERKEFCEHFHNIGYLVSNEDWFWKEIIGNQYQDSYFATLYYLVHPSKKPLDQIIKDQFNDLSPLTKEAYKYICCFSQYNSVMNMELLVRALNCSYTEFVDEVLKKDADKVIFQEIDKQGNIFFRAHHNIIAKKTMDFFFGDSEIQKNIFVNILKECVLHNLPERELCENLLINKLGPNSGNSYFSNGQLREIFSAVCKRNKVRSIIHHWGVLETEDQNFEEAEDKLKMALELEKDEGSTFKGESDQNILTSLGKLMSNNGIRALSEGKLKEGEDYFLKAEEYFSIAKFGEFPNVHAYHSNAFMWYQRGIKKNHSPISIEYFAKALEILAVAKDNLNIDDFKIIFELEEKIWIELGDEEKVISYMELLRDNFNSAQGYYINAEFLLKKSKSIEKSYKNKIETEKNQNIKDELIGECSLHVKDLIKKAIKKVKNGLKFFNNDENCLRLHAKLLKEFDPFNYSIYYEALLKWNNASKERNVVLTYELGRMSFILGYFDLSKKYFNELSTSIGTSHNLRTRGKNPIVDENGKIKEFDGTIMNIYSKTDGKIRCDSLNNVKHFLDFRPIASNFSPKVSDSIKFNIEFSFRGPRAENVKKV